uniref:Pentatricopeptide repeat-containing protein n=1 Tax=Chenopodium quinoa TaxID=63459 RepID=A0A803M5U6_CHEQI
MLTVVIEKLSWKRRCQYWSETSQRDSVSHFQHPKSLDFFVDSDSNRSKIPIQGIERVEGVSAEIKGVPGKGKLLSKGKQKGKAKLERGSGSVKADLLDTLTELQRQNHLDLALQVFDFVKKEYKPDLPLYYDMILLLGKNKLIHKAEELFDELKKEGLQPDVRAYTELIGAYFQVDMVEKAVETYNEMKVSGCIPDKLTLMIMVRNLEKAGKEELAASVKSDFEEYVDEPEKFLEEVEKKYGRDLSIV